MAENFPQGHDFLFWGFVAPTRTEANRASSRAQRFYDLYRNFPGVNKDLKKQQKEGKEQETIRCMFGIYIEVIDYVQNHDRSGIVGPIFYPDLSPYS